MSKKDKEKQKRAQEKRKKQQTEEARWLEEYSRVKQQLCTAIAVRLSKRAAELGLERTVEDLVEEIEGTVEALPRQGVHLEDERAYACVACVVEAGLCDEAGVLSFDPGVAEFQKFCRDRHMTA